MNKFVLAILLLTATCFSQNVRAGKLAGIDMYWQNETIQFDTVGWSDIEKTLKNEKDSRGPSVESYTRSGYSIFDLTAVNSISIAILRDLGFKVILLTQWNVLPSEDILVSSKAMPEHYKRQRIMSDFIWDTISDLQVEKPSGAIPDFRITMFFKNGDFSEYTGKEDLYKAFPPSSSTTDAFRLRFDDKSVHEQVVKRKIHRCLLITKSTVKPATIISDIEKTMDKLKLDMSYKPPVLKLLRKWPVGL